MKSFFNYAKNRFLYNILRILSIMILGLVAGKLFLFNTIEVKADIVDFKFIDYKPSAAVKQTYFTVGESYTYTRDYILFTGTNRFFEFSYCATGYLDFGFPNDFEGKTYVVGYHSGGSCNVQGYGGTVYSLYFIARQFNDAGNGNYSIMFNTNVTNNMQYMVFIDVLSLTNVSSIPAGVQIPTYDGQFNTINTKIDSVDQALEEIQKAQDSTENKINELKESQNTTNEKLDTAENTRKSIWQTIKDLPGAFLNMLKSLIIPDNFEFIYDFKDSLENKLGFIASVPLRFIDYILSLPNKVFTPITSISFPEIEVFGTKFWNGQDVDITEGLSWFQGIKYFGDILCVVLMVNTLNKWWKKFGGGSK